MKYIVLDTNIYIEYKDVEQIPWSKVLTNGEDFEIIVPSVVIEEIGKHKSNPRVKKQKRAKSTAAKFGKYFLGNDYSGRIKYRQIEQPLDSDIYIQKRLNINVVDHVILASILVSGIDMKDVVMVSADIGILIKAKELLIPFHQISDEYKLAEELSDEQKELIQTKKELDQYKNRMPKPSVKFADETDILRLSIPKIEDHSIEIARLIYEEKQKYQPAVLEEAVTSTSPQSIDIRISDSFFRLTQDDIDIYNKNVEKYHIDYENYLKVKYAKEDNDSRAYTIKLVLCNYGTAPTGNVTIELTFPDTVNLYPYKTHKSYNKIETPQKLTKFQRQMNDISSMGKYINVLPSMGGYSPPSTTDKVSLHDFSNVAAKRKLTFHVDEPIKQYTLLKLKTDDVVIDKLTTKSFSIDWMIIDSALPKPEFGQLKVILD